MKNKKFLEYYERQKAERFKKSPVAKIIRELRRKGKSNAEIKTLAPRILQEKRNAKKEQTVIQKYSPFRRAAALARIKHGEEETG